MVGGYIWGLRYAAPARSDEPEVMGAPMVSHGLWLALLGHGFLFAVAVNFDWAVPPWPLFGALAVVTLAFSTAALAARNAPIHFASVAMTAVILVAWRGVTQQAGYAETAIAAFGVLTVFALAWIAVMKRFATIAALAAVTVIVISEINLTLMMLAPLPASLPIALSAHVIGFVILLAMVTRYAWPNAASAVALLGGMAAASILLPASPVRPRRADLRRRHLSALCALSARARIARA